MSLVLRVGVLAIVALVVLAAGAAIRAWRSLRRRRALRSAPIPELSHGEPTILLFTGTLCTDCIRQKEILETVLKVKRWRVHEIHAARDVHVARRFGVESVPATVIIDAGGHPRAVNYGLVSADILGRQLSFG